MSILNAITAGAGGVALSGDTTGNLTIQSAGTNVATFTASGNLTFSVANAGIQFNKSGGLTNTVLNDYEEGTWTPTYYCDGTAGTTTYTNQKGTYTKIGRQVFVECDVSWSNQTGTGSGLIGGLPFTTNYNSYDSRGLVALNAYGGYSYTGVFVGIVNNNATYVLLYVNNNGSLGGASKSTSGEIRMQMSYIVA